MASRRQSPQKLPIPGLGSSGTTPRPRNRSGFNPRTIIGRAASNVGLVPTGDGVGDDEYNRLVSEAESWADAQRQSQATPIGGGGDGLSASDRLNQRNLNRFTQQLQGMLTSGQYRAPQDQLMSVLQQQYGAATPQINTAYDNLVSQLQAQQNPYAGITAQATPVTPQLEQLLQSQGVSTDPLQQFATALNTQNQGQATAFQNLINTMSGMESAGQKSMIDAANAQRAQALAALEGQRAGFGTQLESQAAGRQQDLMTMLLDAISKGGAPRGGSLFGSSKPKKNPKGTGRNRGGNK